VVPGAWLQRGFPREAERSGAAGGGRASAGVTGEEEKWAEKSEWTRRGLSPGAGGGGGREPRLCLQGRSPPARLPGPPPWSLSPNSNPALPLRLVPAPVPLSGSPLVFCRPSPCSLSLQDSYLASPPPPAFYLSRPGSELCSLPSSPFLTQPLHSNSAFLQVPQPPRASSSVPPAPAPAARTPDEAVTARGGAAGPRPAETARPRREALRKVPETRGGSGGKDRTYCLASPNSLSP
jgi:hypothetical protein